MPSYMFSEKAGLLAFAQGDKYHILNGGWEGTRKDNLFTVDFTGQSFIVDDWVEVNSREWPLEKQKQWYFRNDIS